MITIEKMLWSLIKFSQLIVKGNVWRSVWRICMWILGLKGLTLRILSRLGSFAVICVNIDVRNKLIQHTTHSINDPVAYCRWHSHRVTSWINQSNCSLVKVIMKQFKTEEIGISLASNPFHPMRSPWVLLKILPKFLLNLQRKVWTKSKISRVVRHGGKGIGVFWSNSM